MNWLQFSRLVHSTYSRNEKLPDLEWITRQGLLAVKFGQVHALRIDLLDERKCRHLAQLYRRVPAIPAESFFSLLDSCGIDGFRDAFVTIDERPLATASVGQVHRGRLKAGDEVVVKAVKADVRRRFTKDIESLRRLFRLIMRLYPPLRQVGDPVGILDDLEALTRTELDLRNERLGQKRLNEIQQTQTRHFDLSAPVPEVYERLSNENVLVTEYVDAPSVGELLEHGDLDYERLLELFRVHGFYMFVIGTFHGDLHPGNVLVDDDGFHFVDTGYICTVDDRLRRGLFAFFEALTRYDYGRCAEAMQEMSTTRLSRDDFERFRRTFCELYADFAGVSVSTVSLTSKMMHTIKLAVSAGMAFDKGIFGIIRSLMYLDGMVLHCNPGAVLIRDMRGPVEELLESLTPVAPLRVRK